MNWSIKKVNATCADLVMDYTRSHNWEQWILLTSDRHIDSVHSDIKMQQKHLAEALGRGAPVLDFGDLFDVMQTRNDKRGTKDDVRPELQGSNYLNRVVDFAMEKLKPYTGCLAVMGQGNHDTAMLKHNEFCLHDHLVGLLRAADSPVVSMGYRGWIRLKFNRSDNNRRKINASLIKNLYFHHGYGGGGPVTRGTIQTNRRAVYLPDADIVATGHIHESWAMPIMRTRLNNAGVECPDRQLHIQLPTYKDEYYGQAGGWHHETGKPPKPLGAWWLRFTYDHESEHIKITPLEAN